MRNAVLTRHAAIVLLACLIAGSGVVLVSAALDAAGQQAGPQLPLFSDVTAAAGIRFRHNNGAFGKKYLPETLGSGGAFLDIDNDGWQDILLVNSKNWPGRSGTKSRTAPVMVS